MVATFGWLILLCPLVGTVLIAALHSRLPGRSAGWLGTAAIALSFACAVVAFVAHAGALARSTAR